MKPVSTLSVTLLVAGMLAMSLSFVLDHYFSINDFTNGLLKGIGLGLALLSLIMRFRTTPPASANL